MKVAIQEIIIKDRVRQDMGDLSQLMNSLENHGQLNPITITQDNELIAGNRRLLAARELGWTYIEANIIGNLSKAEKLELELEENIHRKEFLHEELIAGYKKLEKLRRPPLSKRIGIFFSKLFSKLLWWRKQPEDDPQPANEPENTTPQEEPEQKQPEQDDRQQANE